MLRDSATAHIVYNYGYMPTIVDIHYCLQKLTFNLFSYRITNVSLSVLCHVSVLLQLQFSYYFVRVIPSAVYNCLGRDYIHQNKTAIRLIFSIN